MWLKQRHEKYLQIGTHPYHAVLGNSVTCNTLTILLDETSSSVTTDAVVKSQQQSPAVEVSTTVDQTDLR
jgi:hypothetical protein